LVQIQPCPPNPRPSFLRMGGRALRSRFSGVRLRLAPDQQELRLPVGLGRFRCSRRRSSSLLAGRSGETRAGNGYRGPISERNRCGKSAAGCPQRFARVRRRTGSAACEAAPGQFANPGACRRARTALAGGGAADAKQAVAVISTAIERGRCIMVMPLPSKQELRVRFPPPAPEKPLFHQDATDKTGLSVSTR
jgi:hypothetical protein